MQNIFRPNIQPPPLSLTLSLFINLYLSLLLSLSLSLINWPTSPGISQVYPGINEKTKRCTDWPLHIYLSSAQVPALKVELGHLLAATL